MLGDPPLTPARARALLDDLRARPLSIDQGAGEARAQNGWRIDDHSQALPNEPPGPPGPGGSFEVARGLMRRYQVADPRIVRAYFDRDEPLEGRTMLLEICFWRLRFHVGVRVTDVYDERREVGGRHADVSGWTYATLQGHLERGSMAWEVWKWHDSGAVEFRIHARSRRARGGNPLVALGFAIFGRREQLRFFEAACARMAALTAQALAAPVAA
jgi:uncharacterized protein (UPF0548 family)